MPIDEVRAQRAFRQGALSEALVASAADAVIVADACGRIVMWNAGAAALFGHAATDAIGRSLDIIMPEAMRGEHAAGMRRIVNGGEARLMGKAVEVPAQHADGRQFPIEMRLSMWGSETERMFGAVIRDVSERRRAQERLHSLALFDQLTQLPNRNLFIERLEQALGDTSDRPVAVLIVDLDHFAELNDAEGHASADELLKQTALRLRRIVVDAPTRSASCAPTVARLGANDFGVLLPDVGDPLTVAALVETIRLAIGEGIVIDGRGVAATASIGIALAPQHGVGVARLIANADFALRRAKADGGDRRQFFLSSQRQAVVARRTMENDLRRAWSAAEFEVHYQPQVRLKDRRILGAEALLRWRHPDRGLLTPGHFIDALERSVLSGEIGDWVLTTACRQVRRWRETCDPKLTVGVNLFGSQFLRPDIGGHVGAALEETGLAADALEIEITENIFTTADDASVSRVRRLRDLGVRIAFDDYGTGYASLSLLKRYPITRLKIDRSFVRDLSGSEGDGAIVDLVVTLGKRFGLDVIAEGVETAEQRDQLIALGCLEGQGYLFGRPVPAMEFERMIERDAKQASRVA